MLQQFLFLRWMRRVLGSQENIFDLFNSRKMKKPQKICCTIHAGFHPNPYFCQESKFYISWSQGLRSASSLQGEEFCLEQKGSNDPLCLSGHKLKPLIFCSSTLNCHIDEAEKHFISLLSSSMSIGTVKVDKAHTQVSFHTLKGLAACDYKEG